jgi:DNA-binding GntR family transcriptional regulator
MNARGESKLFSTPALYEQVAERLRARIYAHELAPGAWVDEQTLADEFGISRTPMREALKVLAAEGLVILKPRRGCYVAEMSERDLDEIFPVLALLEGRVAEEATCRLASADFSRLLAIHADLERYAATNDADHFFEANQAFHNCLQELAGNRWLSQLINDTRKFLKLTRRDSLRLHGRIEQSLAEHRTILAAIEKRDAAAAALHMHNHILSGRAALAKLHKQP